MTDTQQKKFEKAMQNLGYIHQLIAASTLKTDIYQPISTLLSETKVDLFNLYHELKTNNNDKSN